LITTNCAVLGVALLVTKNNMSIIDGTLYTMFSATGFAFAIVIFAGIREQLDLVKIPKGMQGVPLALVTAGILAMAFMGFANLV
jgi:electron transport complex protein RnfA